MAGKLSGLAERKALLVAQCDAARVEFVLEAQVLRRQTRWVETGYQVARFIGPKLKLLSPLLGVWAAGTISRGPRILQVAHSLWGMGRQALPYLRGLRAGS
ncbi:MAG: hypothetical protein SFU85_05045 [Candidatus Methylacidiphilales bacterium]|nr:hypothetical protein [Candidatus Methylacidiphilales bacterium]